MRGAQPLASWSRRLETRWERAIGLSCGGPAVSASTPTAAASAASISAFVGGSVSATLYVPGGTRSAATIAVAASSSQSVGRYAPGAPAASDALLVLEYLPGTPLATRRRPQLATAPDLAPTLAAEPLTLAAGRPAAAGR